MLAAVMVLVLFASALPAEARPRSGEESAAKRLASWERQLVLPEKIESRLGWSERRLLPSGRRKLGPIARSLAAEVAAGAAFPAVRAKAVAEIETAFPLLEGLDVEEAAFIVLSLAAAEMDGDLRAVLAEAKAAGAAKSRLGEMVGKLDRWIAEESAGGGKTASRSETVTARQAAAAPVAAARRMVPEAKTSPAIRLEYFKAPVVAPLPARNPGLDAARLAAVRDGVRANLDTLSEMSEMTSLRLQATMERRSKFIETLSRIMKKTGSTQETLVQNLK